MTQYAGNDAFPADFTIPDDSAPPTAAELLVSIEAIADRTVWLKNRTGALRLIAEGGLMYPDEPSTGTASLSIPTVVTLGSHAVSLGDTRHGTATYWPILGLGTLAVDDVVQFEISGMVAVQSAGSDIAAIYPLPEILAIIQDGGVAGVVSGAKQYFQGPIPAAGFASMQRLSIDGEYVVQNAGSGVLALDGKLGGLGAGAGTVKLCGPFTGRVRVYRSNPA